MVLAAGLARRMRGPKLVFRWGRTTVIGRVVTTLLEAGCAPVVVVTGGWRAQVEAALAHLPVRCVHNPHHRDGSMTRSLQCGLALLQAEPGPQAALVALGDQPAIPPQVPRALLQAWPTAPQAVWQPEHRGRAGHPWLLPRRWWPALLAWPAERPLRAFLRTLPRRRLPVDTSAIHRDLDTIDDYLAQRPAA